MKKRKLDLTELKLNSFVTSLEEQNKKTIEGGVSPLLISTAYVASYHNCQKAGKAIGTIVSWAASQIPAVCRLLAGVD